jgi:hypothetical protein
VGRKLLALEKDLGSKELLARASYIRYTAREHTADHLLRKLKGENVRPGDFSRLRIRKGRGTKRLIIECDHAEFLFTIVARWKPHLCREETYSQLRSR